VNSTPLLFDIEDMVVSRPFQRVAPVVVEATEDDVTGVADIACSANCSIIWDWCRLPIAADCVPSARVATPVVSATARWWNCSWPAVTSSPMSRC